MTRLRRRDFDARPSRARMASRVAATPATPRVVSRRAARETRRARASARANAGTSARDDDGDDAATLRALADARANRPTTSARRGERWRSCARRARRSRALGSTRAWNSALRAVARAANEDDGKARGARSVGVHARWEGAVE